MPEPQKRRLTATACHPTQATPWDRLLPPPPPRLVSPTCSRYPSPTVTHVDSCSLGRPNPHPPIAPTVSTPRPHPAARGGGAGGKTLPWPGLSTHAPRTPTHVHGCCLLTPSPPLPPPPRPCRAAPRRLSAVFQVLAPYDSEDARGLMKAAIRDPDPVIFLENEMLYGVAFPVTPQVSEGQPARRGHAHELGLRQALEQGLDTQRYTRARVHASTHAHLACMHAHAQHAHRYACTPSMHARTRA